MKKRIFSGLLAVVLFATLVLTIPFDVSAATYRPGTASSSYTTPNVGDIVYLNPKLYTYSAGSNSESLKFSGNYSYNQEKSSSTTEHRTSSNKEFRSVAYIYHLSEDVRVPAYSKMTITGYVKSEAKKEGSNNAQNAYAAVVQAANVLLFNPNDLLLGDRIEAATVILGTGASVLVGTKVGDIIAKTPIGADPTVGTPVRVFCSTLVSGLISCTMLLVLDRSKFISKAITALNMYLTEVQSFRQIAYDFETYAAQIATLDVEKFRKDTEQFQIIADELYIADDDEELDCILTAALDSLAISAPWSGDFEDRKRG